VLDEKREFEKFVRRCQQDFQNRTVSDELHKLVVRRADDRNYLGVPKVKFVDELERYINFQNDLRGFWRILKQCECNFETLSRYISSKHDFDMSNETSDEDEDEEQERVEGDGKENEEPPAKKIATSEDPVSK
jgi:hypothetical protein